jgi:hypothetical protein
MLQSGRIQPTRRQRRQRDLKIKESNTMSNTDKYQPPEVWTWDADNGGE